MRRRKVPPSELDLSASQNIAKREQFEMPKFTQAEINCGNKFGLGSKKYDLLVY
jgi:3-dehydroquinate dehydratase